MLPSKHSPCRSVLGSCHQANIKTGQMEWEIGGTQCTVIALAALLLACRTGPDCWTNNSIDHILVEGDGLYRHIIDTFHNGNHSQLLGADDLPSQVSIFESTFALDFHTTLFGIIGAPANPNFNMITINDAIHSSLQVSHYIIATMNGQTIATFASGNQFHVFDSHARNAFGESDPNGFAVLLSFNTFHELINYFTHLYIDQRFDITPVTVNAINVSDNDTHTFKNLHTNSIYGHTRPAASVNTHVSDISHSSLYVLKSPRHIHETEVSVLPKSKVKCLHTFQLNHSYSAPSSILFDQDSNDKDSLKSDTDAHLSRLNKAQSIQHSPDIYQNLECKTQKSHFSCSSPTNHTYAKSHADAHWPKLNKAQSIQHSPDIYQNLECKTQKSHFSCSSPINHTYAKSLSCSLHSCYKVSNSTGCPRTNNSVQASDTNNVDDSHSVQDPPTDNQDPLTWSGQSLEYEYAIRSRPTSYCISCNRFLFDNLVYHTKIQNDVTKSLKIDGKSALCAICIQSVRQGKIPPTCMQVSSLFISQIPHVLGCLNKIERRLLALIQVFITLIILPGGQYAEKGLVLNMPVNITQINSQLPQLQHNTTCLVSFDDSHSSAQYLFDPSKVWEAYNWLKCNNHLYYHVKNNTAFTNSTSEKNVANVSLCLDDVEENVLIPVNYTDPLLSTNSTSHFPSLHVRHSTADPVSIYEIPYGEEKAFPWLFPHGKFGYTYPRSQNIGFSMYLRTRLYNRNPVWRKDLSYLLHAAVSFDIILTKTGYWCVSQNHAWT